MKNNDPSMVYIQRNNLVDQSIKFFNKHMVNVRCTSELEEIRRGNTRVNTQATSQKAIEKTIKKLIGVSDITGKMNTQELEPYYKIDSFRSEMITNKYALCSEEDYYNCALEWYSLNYIPGYRQTVIMDSYD